MRRIEALLIARFVDERQPPARDPTRSRRIAIACACAAAVLVAVIVALAP